ncbi:MAG: molybdopterin molybdotransferase MoeA [Opitutales bacterium]|jgi:molybdopterin molybdotransferase
MKSLITPEDARRLIQENLNKMPQVLCPLDKCAGRILRQQVLSDRPFPPFNRSMMDGYAIRASDIDGNALFNIVAECSAGDPQITLDSRPLSCAEIMTGAILPENADCVVPYETTTRPHTTQMQLKSPTEHAAGDCIHKLGSDRAADAILLDEGATIGARETAIAASCGYADLLVSRKPALAVVSTGDELINICDEPEPHQIRRSNHLMIDTALERIGLNVREFVHLKDDCAQSINELKLLLENNDVIIISGGISMGKKDFIPEALQELGFTCHFHGVAQKPGKPFGFWTNEDSAVFALPGNPLSSLSCLHHYVIPSLFDASGKTANCPAVELTLRTDAKTRDDMTVLLPVKKSPGNLISPQLVNNSGDLVGILESDGYIVLPPRDEKSYPAGSQFEFFPWY